MGYGLFWLVRYRWPYFVKRFWTRPLEDWELDELDEPEGPEEWDAPEDAWVEPACAPCSAAERGWGDETQLLWRKYFTQERGGEM